MRVQLKSSRVFFCETNEMRLPLPVSLELVKTCQSIFGLAKNASASSTTDNLAFAKVALNCERSSSLAECILTFF